MFDGIKSRILENKYRVELLRQGLKDIKEGIGRIEDKDEVDWEKIGEARTTGIKDVWEGDRETVVNEIRKKFYTTKAKQLVRTMTSFIIGTGVDITANDEDKRVQEYWDRWDKENKFKSKRQAEIVKRLIRDGEVFIRFTDDRSKIRFIDPLEIKDWSGKITDGIETDEDDVETVIRYYRTWVDKKGISNSEVIEADDIIHIKTDCDSDEKRGRSVLLGAMPEIEKQARWLNDRFLFNKIRNFVALVRKFNGANVEESGKEFYNQARKLTGPTTITANQGVEYQMLSPNLGARDAGEDGRRFELQIASKLGLAEYMVSADASNANYSSQMVSESPAVKNFENWQAFFKGEFELIFEKVIEAGINDGKLPQQSKETGDDGEVIDIPTKTTCSMAFPTLIARNLKEDTEAYVTHQAMGIASERTIASKLGYDYDQEKELMDMEQSPEVKQEAKYEKQREKIIQ